MPDEPSCRLIRNVREEDGSLMVEFAGSIEIDLSPELRDDLLGLVREKQPKKLIANMKDVPYIGSAGLAVFVEAVKALDKQNGGKLYMTELQPKVKGLLEIIHLDQLFNPCKDEAEAAGK